MKHITGANKAAYICSSIEDQRLKDYFYMCAQKSTTPGLVGSILTNKCPHCREGRLFLNPNPYDLKMTMQMPDECPVCGQKFELQTGFYFGTGFVSYGMTVLFSGLTFAIWWLTIGMGIHDNRVLWWLGVNAGLLILLQPPIQRLSRSIWIAFFVSFDKNWRNHKTVSAQ